MGALIERLHILVLMSAYNGEKYIAAQIESIINQKVDAEIRLRIRDDGSDDHTCLIIEKLIEKYPNKIELIKGANIGYNGSFFALLNSADGYDFYALSDQDDVWLEDKIQRALDKLCKEDETIPLLYASTSFLVEDDLIPYGTTRKKKREFSIYNTIIQNICPGHTQVINNSLLKLIKTDISVDRIYVYDLWVCNMAMLYGKILFDNESYTYYRQHRKNQFGYGKGKVGQLLTSIKRASSGDGKKCRKQMEYFLEKNKNELVKRGFYKEINRFLECKRGIQKIGYLVTGKLYRQTKIETILFYAAVVFGIY